MGSVYKIILPDGSLFIVNSGSCISYASDFPENRKLNVQGEVYLDVRKDAKAPFCREDESFGSYRAGNIIQCNRLCKRYGDSSGKLVQGSVDVTVDNKEKSACSLINVFQKTTVQ